MLPISLKLSGPPARKSSYQAPVSGVEEKLDKLQQAKAPSSDNKLRATLGAMASLALTLAPQASQAAHEAFLPVHQQMDMQRAMNKAAVGPEFGKATEGKIPPGSLLLSDTFDPMGLGEPGHGVVVNLAGRQQGFRGTVFANGTQLSNASRSAYHSLSELSEPDLDREMVEHYIGDYAAKSAEGLVLEQVTNVHRALEAETQNSVLNVSMGTSKARLTNELYSEGAQAWLSQDPEVAKSARTVLKNYASAFELDFQKLTHSDAAQAGPERLKLRQNLADVVSSALDSSQSLASAREEWAEVVVDFEESGHNSVVVSAGNQGDWQSVPGEAPLGSIQQSSDFETNILETQAVTSVGATRWFKTPKGLVERVAGYSSQSEGTDIYASGSVALQDSGEAKIWGTSFSAPRVSVTMAKLHEDNPEMSSQQVEDLMKSTLTHQLQTEEGTVSVLDYQLASDYLVRP